MGRFTCIVVAAACNILRAARSEVTGLPEVTQTVAVFVEQEGGRDEEREIEKEGGREGVSVCVLVSLCVCMCVYVSVTRN